MLQEKRRLGLKERFFDISKDTPHAVYKPHQFHKLSLGDNKAEAYTKLELRTPSSTLFSRLHKPFLGGFEWKTPLAMIDHNRVLVLL